jgi:tetratricopeptide (TPR) repeat protein
VLAIDDLALVLAKAIASEVGKRAGRGLGARVTAALGRDPGRQALERALRRALVGFSAEHAQWTSSFFDAHFLETRAAPLIARMITTGDPPTANELATAWREQFGPGTSGIDEIEPAAAAFVRILRKELRAEDEFRPMLDSHSLDTIAEAIVVIAERQPEPPAEPHVRPVARTDVPAWRVAVPSRHFLGRDDELHRMQGALADGMIVAIHGLGGVGKSQLVAEYARRHRGEYDVAWWVRAEDERTRVEDLAELAYALGVAAASEADLAAAAGAALRWLEQHERWLLILDDVRDSEDVRALGLRGHVIVTSRRHADWPAAGARPIELNVWARADSMRFLFRRTGSDEADAATSIAEALGDLPLALEQAAAYTIRQRISLGTYLGRVRDRGRYLLSEGAPRDYGQSVATTWSLALDELNADPIARFVLAVCAFLAPAPLSRSLFYSHVTTADGASASRMLDEAIERLLGYSLVSTEGDDLTIHRLVQQLTRELIGAPGAEDALTLVYVSFPREDQNMECWPESARLLPHVLAALEHAEAAQVRPEQTLELLISVASYLRVRGNLTESQNLLERAIAIAISTYGADNVQIAGALNDLGVVCRERGDLTRARELLTRALDLNRRADADETRITVVMINLATVLDQLHELDAALELYEAAMPAIERAGIPQFTATVLNDMAIIFDQQAKFAEARELYERALEVEFAMPGGTGHPRVGDTRLNLSITLLHLDDLDASRTEVESAVSIFTSAYDADHPQLARALDQLGTVLRQQADFEAARRTYESALEMCRRVFPPMHPDTARVLANLGIVARCQGDYAGARGRYLEALEIQQRTLGPEHPDVGRTFSALANAMHLDGDADGARRHFARSLQIQLAARGIEHPEVVELLRVLGLGAFELSRPDQVAELQRALATFLGDQPDDQR